MMTLHEAVEAVNERKRAVLGPDPMPDADFTWQRAESAAQDMAILSGYDVDYDELIHLLETMSMAFCNMACHVGLLETFKAALAEALQIGLVKGADSRS